jgi:hypothetical protein
VRTVVAFLLRRIFSCFANVAANVIIERSGHMARGLIVVVYSLVLAFLVCD